jgi:hypothetical protein
VQGQGFWMKEENDSLCEAVIFIVLTVCDRPCSFGCVARSGIYAANEIKQEVNIQAG